MTVSEFLAWARNRVRIGRCGGEHPGDGMCELWRGFDDEWEVCGYCRVIVEAAQELGVSDDDR